MTTTFQSERPSDAPTARRCPAQIAHYRVFELIGAGGMGSVYRAEDTALRREVALKVMTPSADEGGRLAAERFLREARALASVAHPNLVSVYQTGSDRGVAYLAMELLKGETLEARVRRGPLPVAEVVRVGEQIAAGLGAVHARGLIHRDIKPSNVWLAGPEGGDEPPACDVKILDFGLARAADESTQLSECGTVVGTPAYMSPEQARGWPLDARTDLFSLGCVLYALATGSAPFASSNPLSQAVLVASEPHVPARDVNPAVPVALSALIDDLLEKNADYRPATADEVRARLRAALRPGATRRARLLALVGGVWLVVLALGAVALWQGAGRSVAAAKFAPSAQPAVAYLSDLPTLGERRFPPPHRPVPPGIDGTVRVRGTTHARGVFMHGAPEFDVPPLRRYALPAGFTRFTADVALNDSAGPESGIVFVVRADEREVWRSPAMYANAAAVRCSADVSSAKVLTLEAHTIGSHWGAHGAWLDPRFEK